MTVIRKREGDKGGCCNPYSELQLEIERVDQTAIDAKTTANETEAYLNTINGKVNEAIAVVPQVQTNTENITQHESRINANTTDINKNKIDIQEQGKDIATLKTKANDNASAIENLENKTGQNKIDIQKQGNDIAALNTKTNNNTAAIETLEDEIGPETVTGTIQYRLKDIDTKLPTAIKEVEMITNASTVTHKATHISGTAESDALPVVSREQAGIMSASVYAAMEDVIANNTSRISVLEQSAPTYDITGLVGPNPTNAEISAAFTQKYPNVPIQAGLRAADYDNAHFWQYGKNTWIILTQIDVQMATNQSLGIVKGSNTDGKIFVETDGSMSLKGYDALVSKDATHDSKINTLEVGLGNANARIDATNTNVANNAQDIVTANGNISTNTNDINGLKGRMATAEGQIATHETKINQNTQSINGLSNDISGLNDRMSTAEGQITTHETKINQHTQSINGLSTDVNGLKTDVNGIKTDVNGLSTDINAMKTGKQDKLIAGQGITIADDGKTIAAKYAPQRIEYAGKDDIFSAFQDFLINAAVGESFEIWYKSGSYTSETVYYMGTTPFVRFGDSSSVYVKLALLSPLVLSSVRELDGTMFRTFYCQHALTQTKLSSSGSEQKGEGTLSLTFGVSSNGTLSYNGGYIKPPFPGSNAYSWKEMSSTLTNLMDNTVASAKFAYINKP